MDKDQILQMSRSENKGQPDEREQSIEKQAAQIGKAVGIAVCLLMVFLAECVLHNRDVWQAVWIIYFAMEGSSNLCKYLKTKKRPQLFWAVLELFCAIAYTGILIIGVVMR